MPQVKAIAGHTDLGGVGHAGRYLEYEKGEDGTRAPEWGSRAVAHDFLNVRASSGPGDDVAWYDQMDATRRAWGNDAPAGKSGRARTYQQYVISPDPRDGCDLQTLRDVTMEWARRWFSDYEVAVVYHDANASRLLHAHVIVNNTNLETGRRIAPYLTRRRAAEINRSLQEIALRHGLRAYDSEHESRTAGEMSAAGTSLDAPAGRGDRARDRPPRARTRRSYDSKVETVLRSKGATPWKDDIRSAIDCALSVSASEAEFLSALANLGVEVTESRSKRRRGKPEWIYHHQSQRALGNRRECGGYRLGAMYTRASVERALALGFANMRQAARAVSAPAAPVDARTRHNIIRGLKVVGYGTRAGDVSIEEVSALLRFNAQHGIASYADYDRTGEPGAERMERIARAMGAFSASREWRSRKARGDAMTVGDYLASRDRSGAGGLEASGVRESRDERGGEGGRGDAGGQELEPTRRL